MSASGGEKSTPSNESQPRSEVANNRQTGSNPITGKTKLVDRPKCPGVVADESKREANLPAVATSPCALISSRVNRGCPVAKWTSPAERLQPDRTSVQTSPLFHGSPIAQVSGHIHGPRFVAFRRDQRNLVWCSVAAIIGLSRDLASLGLAPSPPAAHSTPAAGAI
jgi:hypothetical protein